MLRDIGRLTAQTFDLLVVGGGIYGLTVAYDAAQRGLTVGLVERNDFGGGASFNHLRTLHGGLRYLQTFDLSRARESIRERRALARIAPHAVRPQPFALPLSRSLGRGKTVMRLGFVLDRLVAADRNRDLPVELRLPGGRVLSRSKAIRQFPDIPREDLTGAAVWFDYVTVEADRLTLSFALAATEHRAVVANYVEATALLRDRRGVSGISAIDRATGRTIEIGARVTVNATGSLVDQLPASLGAPTRIPMLKAMNFVTSRAAGAYALGGRSPLGRHLFMVPWRGRALFGTWESGRFCAGDAVGVAEGEVAAFLDDLNDAFPWLALNRDDITLVHRGVVPAVMQPDGRVTLAADEQILDHAAAGAEGLMSVVGTKYTTARATAERVTDLVIAKLQRRHLAPCRTATAPLLGENGSQAAPTSADGWASSDTMAHLVSVYGPRWGDIVNLAADRPDWRTPLSADSPVIGAQLVWATRHEMALTLCDAAVRRTPLGALGFPGDTVASAAADIVGGELGWSEQRKREELTAFKRFYKVGP